MDSGAGSCHVGGEPPADPRPWVALCALAEAWPRASSVPRHAGLARISAPFERVRPPAQPAPSRGPSTASSPTRPDRASLTKTIPGLTYDDSPTPMRTHTGRRNSSAAPRARHLLRRCRRSVQHARATFIAALTSPASAPEDSSSSDPQRQDRGRADLAGVAVSLVHRGLLAEVLP